MIENQMLNMGPEFAGFFSCVLFSTDEVSDYFNVTQKMKRICYFTAYTHSWYSLSGKPQFLNVLWYRFSKALQTALMVVVWITLLHEWTHCCVQEVILRLFEFCDMMCYPARSSHEKMGHYGHEGMDIVSNNTHGGCAI